ncbi:heme exporter protein D [Arthrobacter oryzae]|uniref:hypothetical protein n=1 Tax=Arthrobacter oryzae TaxID=409290 RepID=UPI00278465F6|nr:hypothetical protein [Arthrobacter oryzae]MDP9988703.1 heme exporter protein D [Arthrobacter oryzae]
MDWIDVGKTALAVATAVIAPGVSLVTLFLKIRESNGRIRAHTIATESYALAKAIGEIGPGDAGSAHAPYLRNDLLRSGHEATRRYLLLSLSRNRKIRNWIDAAVYSTMCLLFGLALLQFPSVLQLDEGSGSLTLLVVGWFLIVLGAISFFLVARAVNRRRRALKRLLRQRFRRFRLHSQRVLIGEVPASDLS